MDRLKIRETLVELLESDVGENFSHVQDHQKLREELGLDSVDVVSVVSQVERHFRIRMSTHELEKLSTVGDVLDLLEGKLNAPRAAAA